MAAYGTFTATNSAQRILTSPKFGRRVSGVIRNTSSTVAYVGFDSSVTSSNGVPINQNDVWETNEPHCYQGDVYVITASSTSDLRYEELK
jgi:hypothetical protein